MGEHNLNFWSAYHTPSQTVATTLHHAVLWLAFDIFQLPQQYVGIAIPAQKILSQDYITSTKKQPHKNRKNEKTQRKPTQNRCELFSLGNCFSMFLSGKIICLHISPRRKTSASLEWYRLTLFAEYFTFMTKESSQKQASKERNTQLPSCQSVLQA